VGKRFAAGGRGGAYMFLNERESAVSDFETAARLSKAQGDTEGYHNAMKVMEVLGIKHIISDSDILFLGSLNVASNPLALFGACILALSHAIWVILNHDRS
jgi:hypothetical protein